MISDLSYTKIPGNVQNYRRSSSGTIPLLGLNAFFSGAGNQITSIPYFAEPRINSGAQSMTTQTDDWNKATLVHNGSQEGLQYFGCWLDFNQTEPQFPPQAPSGNDGPFSGRVPILQLVRGIHQCLVAEIRFQPGATDPIPNGATPSSSDRLAQRNLAIVESDNPGIASTHVVQHTLLVKASDRRAAKDFAAVAVADTGDPRTLYDELVIRWNDIPRDTMASFYSPDWDAHAIVKFAATLRPGPQVLSVLDANTIGCPAGDITYIPIPGQVSKPIPGLVTLHLPLSVRAGQQFKVDVQQHSGLTFQRTRRGRSDATLAARQDYNLSRRKVLGAFRMTVLVQTGPRLVSKLVRNLAVLRYIFPAIPAADSWRPVFERYIRQLGDQVSGLGVDPAQVPASADDPGVPGHGHGDVHSVTGKVSEVMFNCFGNFEGFLLEGCGEVHRFRSTEPAIGELALRACRDRLWVSVLVRDGREERICELIIRAGFPEGPCH